MVAPTEFARAWRVDVFFCVLTEVYRTFFKIKVCKIFLQKSIYKSSKSVYNNIRYKKSVSGKKPTVEITENHRVC